MLAARRVSKRESLVKHEVAIARVSGETSTSSPVRREEKKEDDETEYACKVRFSR